MIMAHMSFICGGVKSLVRMIFDVFRRADRRAAEHLRSLK